jgi:Helicase conserved C-terminal domain
VFLSTDAGSLGLNLQVANVVINLDLPWNPEKLEQRIARAWRKHQTRSVQVIHFVCENSIEHRMLHVLAQKQTLSKGVLEGAESLKEMALPSGRAAFMERMQALMSASETTDLEAPIPQSVHTDAPSVPGSEADQGLKVFQNQINDWVLEAKRIASFGDKVLLVLDSDDPKDLPLDPESPQVAADALERVDTRTFETIQRLIQAGILSLGSSTHILRTQKDCLESIEQVLRERLEQAEACLKVAELDQRMAGVLIEQDFEEEGLAPLSQSFFKVLEACTYLGSEHKSLVKKAWTRDAIQAFIEKGYLAPGADIVWNHFQGPVEAAILDIKAIQEICHQCLKKVQSIQEARDLKKQPDRSALLFEGHA